MNKFGIVLGVAAVATLAGCKDPDFKHATAPTAQEEVKNAEAIEIEPSVPKCMCAPGTKHASPCTCGAPDCKCVVEQKPIVTADLSRPAMPATPVASGAVSEAAYTIYTVRSGDSLSKISKRYNVTISSIKRLNPAIKKDVILVGQKLKLPGKIDVSVPTTSAAATGAVKTAKKAAKAKKSSYAPYTGATKEYVVQSGDTLGSVAYGNGINIRQLKELNGLSKDALKVGQKLKIPAEKVEKKAVASVAKKTEEAVVAPVEAKPVESAAPAAAVEEVKAEEKPAEDVTAPAPEAPKADGAAAPAATYVVQEGDDMTSVSIRWGVSAADIRELNNLADGDQLVPGQIIKLPAEAQQ